MTKLCMNKSWYENNFLKKIKESSDMEYTLTYKVSWLTSDDIIIRHFKADSDDEAVRKIIRNMDVGFKEENLDDWIDEGEVDDTPEGICLKIEKTKYLRKFRLKNDTTDSIIWDTYEDDTDEQYVNW